MGSEANVESQTASGQCVREMCHLQQEARCAALSKTVRHENYISRHRCCLKKQYKEE